MDKVADSLRELAWLIALEKGPIRRDGNSNAIPFDVATRLLEKSQIMPSTERHSGLATQVWRTWEITTAGRERLAECRSEQEK